MHCFSGNQQQAERSLAAGFYLSFAGNVTYPKSTTIQDVARDAPADRILVETDAPFLAPGSASRPAQRAGEHRAHRRVPRRTRGVPAAQFAAQTTQNFFQLFPSARAV